jgi:hypothetical protein
MSETPGPEVIGPGERAVITALLVAGADPAAGTPSAEDTARMFGKADLLELFGAR